MEEEVKVSELPMATNVDDDDLVMVVQDGFNKQVTKENFQKEKVNKSGDTLTGFLDFENKNEFHAFLKTRTLNGTDYQVAVGVGGNNSARMEFVQNNNILSSVEARIDGGIYNGKTGNRLIETKSEINYDNWHSVVFTRSDNDYLYIMLYGSDCLKEGTYSIPNSFALVTYGTTSGTLTIPASAIKGVSRRDWGFEVVVKRSGITGITSGQYNGTAVVSDGTLTLSAT